MNGIVIPVFGEKAIAEGQAALNQIHRVWPDVTAQLYIYEPMEPIMKLKMEVMRDTVFDRTLIMDADTWLVEPVPELFALLDWFDIAVAHAPFREVYDVGVPLAFPEYNIGVMSFKKSGELSKVVRRWQRDFTKDSVERSEERRVSWFPSQATFRRALYESKLRICTLPPEYNWRGTGYVHHSVKIVHKRPAREEEAYRINAITGPRIATLHEVMPV
jgi:hypothetical protein